MFIVCRIFGAHERFRTRRPGLLSEEMRPQLQGKMAEDQSQESLGLRVRTAEHVQMSRVRPDVQTQVHAQIAHGVQTQNRHRKRLSMIRLDIYLFIYLKFIFFFF